jgi:TonB family protein
MTPTIFGYVVLLTLLLVGAAAAVEWGMQGRAGARHVWTVAIAIALVAPPVAVTWHTISATATPPGAGQMQPQASPSATAIATVAGQGAEVSPWRRIMKSASVALTAASAAFAASAGWGAHAATLALGVWAILSLALLAWLVIGVLRWRAARLAWARVTLDGIDVDVSPSTGPAVLGFLSHRIVLPSWATRMEPEHRRLILAHESEHIDAHDPERLALAIAAILLMPWNIGLWICAARLRRAIEIDCDARVLKRFPGTREYGYVLLEVASRGRRSGPLAIPMVALLRLPSELEQRLKAMTRKRTLGYRSAIGGGLAAIAAVSVAFAAPVPLAQVPEGTHAVPAATSSRVPFVTTDGRTNNRQILDTVPKTSRNSDTLTARQRDSLRVIAREMNARGAAVEKAQTRVEAAKAELNERQIELNAVKKHAQALKPGIAANSYQTYFSYQVTKPVAPRDGSPSPVYPDALLKRHISGEVDAMFVVDASGHVIPGSTKVRHSTDPLLTDAVLEALPKMQFIPAEVHGTPVKQLVQQPFTFAVSRKPQ